jgi:hypothetical protein
VSSLGGPGELLNRTARVAGETAHPAMIPENRVALFEALAELCRQYPNWRFGQLVSNVAGWADLDTWDIEDGQLLAAARDHLDQIADGQCETSTSREATQKS